MSVGTAIFVVGAMFFVLALVGFGFMAFLYWQSEAERRESLREIEERRESIGRGARRSDHRLNL